MASRILAAALCLALLCGCSSISMNVEDLLIPPSLNERQARVEDALRSTTSLNSILYRYPQRGENRSPFVFYDLDGDGADEAVVFFADRTGGNVRFKVLRENSDGSWVQLQDLSGDGDQIDFIQFSRVLSADSECMVIGWQNTQRGTSTLEVHTFDGERLRREVQSSYQSHSIDDYLGDGLSEILLVRQDASSDRFQLVLLGCTADGRFKELGTHDLPPEVGAVLQMCKGRLWGNSHAVYIDELLGDSTVATEVIQVARTGLSSLVGVEQFDLYEQTLRDEEILCVDLREDGLVEIPTQADLPGYTLNEIEPPPLTRYMRLSSTGALHVVYNAAVNDSAGYMVYFPDRWLENVTIQRSPESNEWRFFTVDPASGLLVAELLRIRVHSTRDYQDQFVIRNYEPLAEKGLFKYYAYLPPTENEPLAITLTELKNMFSLL